MKRFVLLFIIFVVGCTGLSSFVNRGGVGINRTADGVTGVNRGSTGINSQGNVSTAPTTMGGTTSTSRINAKVMKDAYLKPILPSGKQNKYAPLVRPVYVIEEKDILNSKVRDEPDLSVTSRVSKKGEISIPLLGDIKVVGLTMQEAAELLQNRYKDGYLNDPIITVEINTQQMLILKEKEVYISGQVQNPGSVILTGKYITVFEAINKSGGLSNLAWPSRTKLIRLENGVKTVIKVNIKKIRKGERSLDIILKPDDVIFVPEAIF